MSGLLVHEWFARTGGSEKVVEQMIKALPGCDLQVLWDDRHEPTPNTRETWLARTPLRRHKALSVPFQLPTWRRLTAHGEYDWMLVSSHLFAHHAKIASQPDIPKFVYAHTPARYIWEPNLDTRGSALHIRAASAILRPLDRRRAQEAIRIAANSEFTRLRIQETWNRDADVLYPPVDVEKILRVHDWSAELTEHERHLLAKLPGKFILGASRMVSYKRLDAVIQAGEATNVPVVIAGDGPLWDALLAQSHKATVRVQLIRRPSDAFLYALYQRCRVFIFPAVEDFGIMPIEAMAAGAPVIVPHLGGAAETAKLLRGGATITSFEVDEWRSALAITDQVEKRALSQRTRTFSQKSFRASLQNWLTPHSTQENASDE